MFKQSFIEYIKDSGGRVSILFLLFLLAVFSFYASGISGIATICSIPLIIVLIYLAFHFKMLIFWTLFLANFFIMGSILYINLPCPISLPCEALEIILIAILILDSKNIEFSRLGNTMFYALLLWFFFACIEMFNNTCNLGFNFIVWITEVRLLVFQLLYIYIIFTLLITDYGTLIKYLRVLAVLCLLATIWVWRQKTFGFNAQELRWLWEGDHARTHIVGGTTRYFSFFSDAANFGCSMASLSILFFILSITAHLKKDKIFFIVTSVACLYSMFTSGTRTAIFCFFIGGFLYIFLSRSFKIAVPVTIIGLLFLFVLAFTQIGQGNNMIRRMRTAFNKDDASKGVRDVNKEAISKYMKEAPWGIGFGMNTAQVPANNKYKIVSGIPPDSTYVYIWVHTGVLGVTLFVMVNVLILLGGCRVVLFKLHNKVLCGIGAAFCCGFIGINLGGYGNQILTQYPNSFIYYGGMALVYLLPKLEPAYIEFEKKDNQRLLEIKKTKEEEKNASRV